MSDEGKKLRDLAEAMSRNAMHEHFAEIGYRHGLEHAARVDGFDPALKRLEGARPREGVRAVVVSADREACRIEWRWSDEERIRVLDFSMETKP